MIAKYLNAYTEKDQIYYDLLFEENDQQEMRLTGLKFHLDDTKETMIEKAHQIFNYNYPNESLPDVELTEILFI
jgi:hypothetical protein